MGSIPTVELIDQIERSFLCATNNEQDLKNIPLLQEFENEMKIYQVEFDFVFLFVEEQLSLFFCQACLSDLSSLSDYWNVRWIRIDLRSIKQTLTSLSHKWLWKFADYLHNQVRTFLFKRKIELFFARFRSMIR